MVLARSLAAAVFLLMLGMASAGAVGFQKVMIPVPGHAPLPGGFWFPSAGPVSHVVGQFFDEDVAVNGPVTGRGLPLVVMSHGAMGSYNAEADLALALAHAGFVVAAITHDELGPNWIVRPAQRSAQIHALIGYALHDWPGHSHLDPARVGAFGYSLGGFTILVAIGGKPDLSRIQPHCLVAPMEWSCTMEAGHRLDMVEQPVPEAAWIADNRIKAAVLAAPAFGYLFGKPGLRTVHVPVQLWRAQDDHVLAEPWNAEAVRHDLPAPPEYHVVPGADHGDLAGLCTKRAEHSDPHICTSPSGFDRDAFHARFNAEVIRFFRQTLEPFR